MPVDLQGRPVPPESRRPSAETLLHTMVYGLREDVGSVLHVHAPRSVAYSRAHLEDGFVCFEGWEIQKGFAGVSTHESIVQVPVFANSQDIGALASIVKAKLASKEAPPAFFLAGHGLYAFGASVAEAKRHVEVVEALLEQLYLWRTAP